jgi:hypothetical protein
LKTPFYVTGQVVGKTFSVHAEGDRVILTREGQAREEVDLASPPSAATPAPLESIAPSLAAVCPGRVWTMDFVERDVDLQ